MTCVNVNLDMLFENRSTLAVVHSSDCLHQWMWLASVVAKSMSPSHGELLLDVAGYEAKLSCMKWSGMGL